MLGTRADILVRASAKTLGGTVGKVVLFLIGLIFAALVGGAVYLIAYDIPAPVAPVERVLDDDRFPRS